MRLFNHYKSRKYYSSIILWISSMVLLIIVLISGFLYYNTEKIVLNNNYIANKKILSQVKYYVNFMDETVKTLCKFLYFNHDVTSIMFNRQNNDDLSDIIIKVNNLNNSISSTNLFVHSLYVYNNYSKTYYSTYSRLFFQDKNLVEIKNIPRLKPLFRNITTTSTNMDNSEPVFTYFMYDNLDTDGNMDGGVVVNVKADWIFENIKNMNIIDIESKDSIYVLSGDGDIVNANGNDDVFTASLKETYLKHVTEKTNQNGEYGSYSSKIDGKNYLVTFVHVENTDIVLIKTQLYAKAYEFVTKLKITFVIISIICLITALIASIYISRRLYKPVDSLIKMVGVKKNQQFQMTNFSDEISYLSNLYSYTNEKLDNYEKERYSYEQIAKDYWKKELLTDSTAIDEDLFVKNISTGKNSLSYQSRFVVCVIKISNYGNLKSTHTNKDIDLYKLAILNITSELVGTCFPNEGVEIKDDHLVLILNVQNQELELQESLIRLLKSAQESIFYYYKIDVCISISDIADEIKDLTRVYKDCTELSMYRFIKGKSAIIISSLVKENMSNINIDFSFSHQKLLIEAIKTGKLNSIEQHLTNVIQDISCLNFGNIIISLMYLTDNIQRTIEDINKNRIEPVYTAIDSIKHRIYEFETIDEYTDNIMSILTEMFEKDITTSSNTKHEILIEAVKDIIGKNYYDSELCSTKIALLLKLSTKYIGKIFFDSVGITISEYICNARLHKATEWLEKSELNIGDIAKKVGIDNETYFYTLFKRKFGVTPKEYSQKQALKGL